MNHMGMDANHLEPISLAQCMRELGFPIERPDDVPADILRDETIHDLENEVAHLQGVNGRLRADLVAAERQVAHLTGLLAEERFERDVVTRRRQHAISRTSRYPYTEGA